MVTQHVTYDTLLKNLTVAWIINLIYRKNYNILFVKYKFILKKSVFKVYDTLHIIYMEESSMDHQMDASDLLLSI